MSFYSIDEKSGEVRDLFSGRRVGDVEEAAVLVALKKIPKKPHVKISITYMMGKFLSGGPAPKK